MEQIGHVEYKILAEKLNYLKDLYSNLVARLKYLQVQCDHSTQVRCIFVYRLPETRN